MEINRAQLLTALAIGLAVSWVAFAAYVLVDDQLQRRAMQGRWARLDQALADADEEAARREVRGLAEDQT